MLSAPGEAHWFGTDQYGRDVFSRIVYGSRTALAVGILASMFGCTAGAVLGAASGYFGGPSTPPSSAWSTSCCRSPSSCWPWWWWRCWASSRCSGIDTNLIAAIALPIIPKMARVARSSTLSIVAMPFIDAARAAGYSHKRIILRHILPNIMAPYLIMVTAFIAQAILLEASLSFLGLG